MQIPGCPPRIKPKSDALFIIRLVDFKVDDIGVEPGEDGSITQFYKKYQDAIKHDCVAKEAFKRNNIGSAITNYLKAVNDIDKCALQDEKEEKVYNNFLERTFLNLAVCYNNQNLPKKACSMLNNVKSFGRFDNNAKALYQEGKALTALGDYTRAHKSLTRAQSLVGEDVSITNAIHDLDEKTAKYKEEERRLARNALGVILKKPSKIDQSTETKEFISSYESNVNKFLDSDLQSLQLPSNLSSDEITALRRMESKMDFKLCINQTSDGREIKLLKLKP